jgi:HK97 gp10 family phage protein
MAVEISLNLESAEEFRVALQHFDSAMQRQVHEQLERWAVGVCEHAKGLTPVRTGYLRSSIYAKIQGWVAEIGSEAAYAMFVEFGTRYMQARPYLYPAIQEHLPHLEQIICDAINQAKAEANLK